MITKRRPWIAALLSVGVPGLGHLYAGRVAAALSALGFAVVAGVGALASGVLLPLPPLNVLLIVPALLLIYVGVPIHAALSARRAPPTYKLRPYNRWYIYLGIYLVAAFLVRPSLYRFTKAHIIEAFRIPSATMEPTIEVGDYLYVAKWAPAVRNLPAGSLVVFQSVEEPSLKILKRVVGTPGDTVAMRGGTLYRNGHPAAEPYVVHREPTRSEDPVQRAKMRYWQAKHLADKSLTDYAPDLEDWGPLVVPPDSVFVLGDNRDESYDSRYYGFVASERIVGRPRVIYLSLAPDSSRSLMDRVRWSRLGLALH